MATLSTTFRQNILHAMLGGTSYQQLRLQLLTSGGTVLATFTKTDWDGLYPSDLTNGVFTWTPAPQEVTASASGTATKARLQGFGSGGTWNDVITDISVGTTSGSEIQMADTSITNGQPVQLTSFTITAPADVVAG